MGLVVVATPIGDPLEISEAAVKSLRDCAILIGEDRAESERLLKRLGIDKKPIELLNEHSREGDVLDLVELCRHSNVALVSDCGTPGFCDPGADLVSACRAEGISVRSAPGPSSLMAFLSVCGRRLDRFLFAGFVSADRELRDQDLKRLLRNEHPVIILDTPYRLGRLTGEIARLDPGRTLVIGMKLGSPDELVLEGLAANLASRLKDHKSEFVLLVLPRSNAVARSRKKSKRKYRSK